MNARTMDLARLYAHIEAAIEATRSLGADGPYASLRGALVYAAGAIEFDLAHAKAVEGRGTRRVERSNPGMKIPKIA